MGGPVEFVDRILETKASCRVSVQKLRCFFKLTISARIRMDAMEMHNHKDPFAGTRLSNASDDILSDIWDWCAIKGCRGVCMSGRLYFKKKPLDKFKWVLGLCLGFGIRLIIERDISF